MSDGYFLSAEQIARAERLDKTHYLNANAKRRNLSLGDMTGLTGIGIHLVEVAPGHVSTEFHAHHDEDEAIYVLSGDGIAEVGDEVFSIGTGDFLGYRKGGLAHAIRNEGTQPLVFLVIGQRLDHDVADYPRLGKRLFRAAGRSPNLVNHTAIEEPELGRKR